MAFAFLLFIAIDDDSWKIIIGQESFLTFISHAEDFLS